MTKKKKDLTFIEHLNELRARLIKSALFLLGACIVACFFARDLLNILIAPAGRLIFTAPTEAFMAYLTVVVIAGAICAMPFILFQGWQFVSQGLSLKERRDALAVLPLCIFLFLAGALFAYFVIIPVALNFLMGFATGTVRPLITVSNYIGFAGMLILVFGLVFDFPLIILFCVHLGFLSTKILQDNRKYAVVAIFILSAFLTPPDCFTQLMMAFPLIGLYELSIVLARFAEDSKTKKKA